MTYYMVYVRTVRKLSFYEKLNPIFTVTTGSYMKQMSYAQNDLKLYHKN